MVGWSYIRSILIIVSLEGLKTIHVEYVQAFTQATIEKYLCQKIPETFQVEDGENHDYALKIHRMIDGKNKLEESGINI